MTDAAQTFPGFGAKAYRAYVLGALLVIYTFNFIDRILLGVVQESIKQDLHVSDFQLGLLGGPAFAILYTLMGIPIARYAERGNRISIVAIGAAVWSIMTAACGFAGSFLQLAAARIGVGIGEAACTPPSHSVISDYFPASRRASALAIWSLGIPIGTMLAAVGGGWLAANVDWRAAFWLLGAPGVLMALALKLTVREPPRSGAADQTPSFGETLATLTSKRSFWHIAIAGALMSFVGYSTAQFLVSYMVRNYGVSVEQASYAFAAIAGFAVAIGTFSGGFVSDRLSHRHPRVYAWLPMIGVLVAAPLYLVAFWVADFWAGFAILMVAPIFHYLYLGPGFAMIQSVAPPRARATATAILLLIMNLIGYGLGPPIMGALSDHFANGELVRMGASLAACKADASAAAVCAPAIAHGLRWAMMCVVCVLFWPALHFWLAGRTLTKDRAG